MDVTDEPIDPELDRLFDLLAEKDREQLDPTEHLGATTLSAYHTRQLSQDERLRVEEHLAVCRSCRDLFLEYSRFLKPPMDSTEEATRFEVEAEWGRLQARITPPRVNQAVVPSRPSHAGGFWRSWETAYSLAALLAVALAVAFFYANSLSRELRRPITDVGVENIQARGSQRSSSPRAYEVRLPNFLAVEIPSTRTFERYRINFKSEQGELIQSFEDKIEEDGTLRFFLPKRFLNPGVYKVDVVGIQGESQERLGIYDVHIVA